MDDVQIGVHIIHCCKKHGCKYGDRDCPVANGDAEQLYPCESCAEDELIRESGITTIQIRLEKCNNNSNGRYKCPYVFSERTPNTGFAVDYFCGAENNKKIAGYVEWDSEMPLVPDWCPKRV